MRDRALKKFNFSQKSVLTFLFEVYFGFKNFAIHRSQILKFEKFVKNVFLKVQVPKI